MLAPQRLVHTSPQRIMLPTLLTLPWLLLPRLSRKVTSTLTLHPSTLRQIQNPPRQTRNLALTLALLVDGIIIVILVLSLARVAIPTTSARCGRRFGELPDGRDEDGRGADVVHELFVA